LALVYHKLVSVREAVDKTWDLLTLAGWPYIDTSPVVESVGRVLARPVYAVVDSPPFDRSAMDGFAVRSSDLATVDELHPRALRVIGRADVGAVFPGEVGTNESVRIATGAPIPRGCDAVVMVEYTKETGETVTIYRGVSPSENVAQAGSDVSMGDLVLRTNRLITSRELAALTAQGMKEVSTYRKPTVGVFSTGNELVPSGSELRLGSIYDVNGPTVTALLREMGVLSEFYGILPDEEGKVMEGLRDALQKHDVVITSGSTSAGFGDMIYRLFDALGSPGVVVHGIKLRPGKPTVIAIADGKLLIGLPGFPLSAMMVFHLVAKPLIWRMAGIQASSSPDSITAKVPFTFEAGRGKRDLVAVQLVQSKSSIVAYPLLSHSGSASSLALADGFIDVPEEREFLQEGETVEVTMLNPALKLADLTIIGSHCLGVDRIIEKLAGFDVKAVNVGSWSGWQAIKRGEADIAGTHLLDEESLQYNVPFLAKNKMEDQAVLVRGYSRKIGLVVAKGNPKHIASIDDVLRKDVLIVNRNKGSGTRTYLDLKLKPLLEGAPASEAVRGYTYEVKTHTAVAAAVQHGRADCGLAFEAVTAFYPVDFIPLDEEVYDFLVSKERLSKPAVRRFIETLSSEEFRKEITSLPGYASMEYTGKIVAGSAPP
jgi:putative molybdopterin biosynthesis protein